MQSLWTPSFTFLWCVIKPVWEKPACKYFQEFNLTDGRRASDLCFVTANVLQGLDWHQIYITDTSNMTQNVNTDWNCSIISSQYVSRRLAQIIFKSFTFLLCTSMSCLKCIKCSSESWYNTRALRERRPPPRQLITPLLSMSQNEYPCTYSLN